MKGTKAVRVLAPEVYDTIELVALAYGGIGRGEWFKYNPVVGDDDRNCPVCAHGIALFAEDTNTSAGYSAVHGASEISRALSAVGITVSANDRAVSTIEDRLHRDFYTRVTFKQWARELNVVRGDVEGYSGIEVR